MPIDFSNTNSVYASILVETLVHLGLKTAVCCPGSRSTPLTIAFARQDAIDAIPVLDERSAAFFALGLAKQSGRPTALVCTSGTAAANFYPAVIEARESRVPLLLLTADRPPELRECNAGQTIDQQKLFGTYPNWYSELAVPLLDLSLLAYLRQTIVHAWEKTLYPVAGAVHLNLPFRDPLAPIPQPEAQTWRDRFPADFFAAIAPAAPEPEQQIASSSTVLLPPADLPIPAASFPSTRGIIIAGVAQPRSPQAYCRSIAKLAEVSGFPVLAEGLSPVRNYADLTPYLVSTYDLMLRDAHLAEQLVPDVVIRVGEMPTSKELRQWLSQTQPRQWVIDPGDRNLDPLHLRTVHLRQSIDQVAATLTDAPAEPTPYLQLWLSAEQKLRRALDERFDRIDSLFESKIVWLLSQVLPAQTPLYIANSMPVRDMEWFWKPGNLAIQPYFNRGANGIDGTLSTALGIAHRNRNSVLLTGDLALLHDTNGFLLRNKLVGHLTILLVNNNGGGIFEMLPVSQFDPPFEAFFATPQSVDFAPLCAAYGVEYERIESWEHLRQRLNPLPDRGVRVLEVRCDRKADRQQRRDLLNLKL